MPVEPTAVYLLKAYWFHLKGKPGFGLTPEPGIVMEDTGEIL